MRPNRRERGPGLRRMELIDALRRPEAYPWRPEAVDLVTTHLSWVFLAGDRVVKVKRPVAYPFVDFRDRERRYHAYLDEVRLNRRLTDGVYLAVLPIVRTSAGCRIGGPGPPIEWATVMRRLPAEAMLDARLARGDGPADLADRLAARLLAFHRDLAPSCGTTAETAEAATRVVTDNLAELAAFRAAPLGATQFDLVAAAMQRFVVEQVALLRERAASDWIREGHGDLRAEHVCVEPDGTIQIFDCVEFSRALRCADVASDLAFLLMDLTRLGASRLAADLVARYRAAGIDLPDALLRFYRAHRALVRAKTACLRLTEAGEEGAVERAKEAADYLDLASGAALTIRPLLIVMTGLSGTGKSTVARRLAQALGARLHVSDVVRKDLAGVAGPAPATWHGGIYDLTWTRATYDRLFALAADDLAHGAPVILDAAFLATEQRHGAADVAARMGVRLLFVETVCDEATARARLAARAAGRSASDATLAIYERQRAALASAPPSMPAGTTLVRIDTAAAFARQLEPVFAAATTVGFV